MSAPKEFRINIMGASGTGKTTLAKTLARKLNCTHFDSDHYYHFPTNPPFQKQRSPSERLILLEGDMKKHNSWVLSGAVGCWEPAPKLDYTLVVFLYLDPHIRLARLKAREHDLFGLRLGRGGDMEATHREFMDWTAGYDSGAIGKGYSLASHEGFLTSLDCSIIRFAEPISTEDQVQRILAF